TEVSKTRPMVQMFKNPNPAMMRTISAVVVAIIFTLMEGPWRLSVADMIGDGKSYSLSLRMAMLRWTGHGRAPGLHRAVQADVGRPHRQLVHRRQRPEHRRLQPHVLRHAAARRGPGAQGQEVLRGARAQHLQGAVHRAPVLARQAAGQVGRDQGHDPGRRAGRDALHPVGHPDLRPGGQHDRRARGAAQRHRRGDGAGEVPGDAGERGPRARAAGDPDPGADQGAARHEPDPAQGAEGAARVQEGADALRYFGRFVVMGLLVAWFAARYALGRLALLFARDRRSAVAHLLGRMLRGLFAALGACFVKLGQVLSTRPDLLDPEMIDELRQLQDRMPAFAFARVREIVEAELGGRLEDHFAALEETPVAAASVAQVHRGRLKDGTEVAVKVLRPGVHEKVERDAAILVAVARMVAVHPTWRLAGPVRHLQHFGAGILAQTNLRPELANYDLFQRNFAGAAGVRFPHVYPALSGERVMTMEFMHGVKVDALPKGDHRELAGRLQRVVLKMCFEDGLFHADLHPGNVL